MSDRTITKQGGSLKISHAVIEKVAKIAATDVKGVKEISVGSTGINGILKKANFVSPVEVSVDGDGVAKIDIHIIVENGAKIPNVCRDVQNAVKTSIQEITEINVSKVNVIISGVETPNDNI